MRQAYPGTVKSRLVGRETEVKVVCNQPGLWNSGGGGGPIGYSLVRHASGLCFLAPAAATVPCPFLNPLAPAPGSQWLLRTESLQWLEPSLQLATAEGSEVHDVCSHPVGLQPPQLGFRSSDLSSILSSVLTAFLWLLGIETVARLHCTLGRGEGCHWERPGAYCSGEWAPRGSPESKGNVRWPAYPQRTPAYGKCGGWVSVNTSELSGGCYIGVLACVHTKECPGSTILVHGPARNAKWATAATLLKAPDATDQG